MGRERLLAFLEVVRLHNVAVTFATTYIGAAAAAKMAGLGPLHPLVSATFWLAAAVVGLVAAGGYAINDYYDVDVDAIDKPWRPIPSGRLRADEVKLLSLTLFAIGVGVSALIGMLALAYAAAAALLLHEYSRWLKRTGLPGNLIVAFNSASSIIYGGLAYAETLSRYDVLAASLIPAAYAFLLVLGREFVKGVEDYRGDLLGGVKTLAVVLGPRKASAIASLLLWLVVVLSPLPYLAGLYGLGYAALAAVMDAIVAYSATLMLANEPLEAAPKARRMLKIAFALGALAFIAGLF